MTAPAEDPRGGEATVHEHGRWCLVGCDEGGSEPLPPADLSHFAARPARDEIEPGFSAESNGRRLKWFTDAELAAELARRRAPDGT